MTAPRQILPGKTWLVTRRCTQREFLLRPSAELSELFVFVLALAAARFGVDVHACCVLSNHYHLVVTDPGARLPAFTQYLDSLVARAMNTALGRSENFWATEECSLVELATPAAIVEKIAYTLANPVAAGLVRSGREWPGVWLSPDHGGSRMVARRPERFFRPEGRVPEVAELELPVPPGFASREEFQSAVSEARERHEREAVRERSSTGRGFLGAKKILAQKTSDRPARGVERSGSMKPRVAARDVPGRVEVLERIRAFVASYRQAWAAWCAGARDTVFPAGTYLLRVSHGVLCEAPCAC